MAFFCVFCNLVTDTRSSQLWYFYPALSSRYRPKASDVFEHRRYCTARPERTRGDFCDYGFEYEVTEYSTLDERSCRRRKPVNGWHGMGQNTASVCDDSCSCFNNCYDACIGDDFGQSSVKRHAQFYSELPSRRRCQCCNTVPGLCCCVNCERVCACCLADIPCCLA